MMPDNQIHSAVVRWVSEVAAVKVIKAYQSGEPPFPYIMVNMLSSKPVRDHPIKEEYNPDTGGTVFAAPVIEVEWHFSLHAYGSSPTDILRPVRSAAHLAQLNEPLMPSLIIFDASLIRHVPDFTEGKWEPRAQMDLFVRGVTRDEFAIDVIEEFSVSVQQTNREGDT